MISQEKRGLALLAFTVVTLLLAWTGPAMAAFGYTGNKSCQKCHKEIYDSWKKTIHAKTFDLLAPKTRADKKKEAGLKPAEDYRKDKSCMRCHVMGWEEGGYSSERADKDEWKGVGCEDCHGSAEKYLEIHEKKDLERRDRKLKQAGLRKPFDQSGQGTCASCHYNQNSPFKHRLPNRDRNWADPKFVETYHIIPKK